MAYMGQDGGNPAFQPAIPNAMLIIDYLTEVVFFGPQMGPQMDPKMGPERDRKWVPKWTLKSLKNQTLASQGPPVTPKAAQPPPGSPSGAHFGLILGAPGPHFRAF